MISEKRKEILKQHHDEVKEHPFWKTLDIDFHSDCVSKLKGLLNEFIGSFWRDERESVPHVVLLYPTMHNLFGSILKAQIAYKQLHKNITDTPAFGNYIMCLQTALQIVHCYLDGLFDEDEMVAYDPYLHYNEEEDTYDKCTYKTFGVRKNEDGTYRSVRIITKDEVPTLIEENKERAADYAETAITYAKKEHPSDFDVTYAKDCLKNAEYFKECVDDLEDNKQKHFIIK